MNLKIEYLKINSCIFQIGLLSLYFEFVTNQGMDVLPTHPKVTWATHIVGDQVTTLLNKPYSPATYASMSSYIYQMYGEQAIIDIESKQACRINSNYCNDNSQCCSKFCRCTRWNTMGKEVCWRKCL